MNSLFEKHAKYLIVENEVEHDAKPDDETLVLSIDVYTESYLCAIEEAQAYSETNRQHFAVYKLVAVASPETISKIRRVQSTAYAYEKVCEVLESKQKRIAELEAELNARKGVDIV